MRWLVVLVLALALVAAGCGGGDDSTASDETTVEETTTSEDTTTSEETTDTDVDASAVLGDEDCLKLASIGATFAQAVTGATDEEATEAFSEFADDVPEEIRADVQTLADAYGQYIAVLQDAGLEPGEIPSAEQAQELSEALESVGTADVTAASERLSSWTTENCR